MNRAPTRRELEILRYLACDMRIEMSVAGVNPLICKDVTVDTVRRMTVDVLYLAGWIELLPGTMTYTITPLGRDVADVKAFVRGFSQQSTHSQGHS